MIDFIIGFIAGVAFSSVCWLLACSAAKALLRDLDKSID
jgi:hypothetical protein